MAVNLSQASRAYTAGDKKSKAQQIKILFNVIESTIALISITCP